MLKDNIKGGLFLFTGAILQMLVTMGTTYVLAHGGDTAKVHACVDDTTGAMRAVGESTTCPSGEHNVDWYENADYGLPFMCTECSLSAYADKFAGKDFSYAQLHRVGLSEVDLSGTNFSHSSFDRVDMTGNDLTGANFSYIGVGGSNRSASFIDADLTNADFSHSGLYARANNSNLTNADFSNAEVSVDLIEANLSNTDFTNSTLSNMDMTGATNATTATFTGVTWDNVTCPDGTNSGDHSDTCIGHLTP